MTRARSRRARRPPGPILGLLVALAIPAGCYEGFDPLDPDVLAEVARGRGDAQGIARSGIYEGGYEPLECGCSSIDAGDFGVSLCGLLDMAASQGVEVLGLEVVQADGSVRVEALPATLLGLDQSTLLLPLLYGSLQEDGRIAAAGVLQADALVAQGQVLARIDGTIEPSGDVWHLQVEYQQRYAVDVLGGGAEFSEQSTVIQSDDCRERIALDLEWVSPPLQSVGSGG